MFKKKKITPAYTFDANRERPIIRCSICTGEKVAGFKNIETGKFTELMLIQSEQDLVTFRNQYHLEDVNIKTEY